MEQRNLFTPLRLGHLELPHRVVMAPMTRSRAGEGSVPTPLMGDYYVQRASAGLMISEASQISPEGTGYPSTPGIYTDQQVAGWQRITHRVHAAGGRIFLQLWHVGRVSHPLIQPEGGLPVAPSALAPEGRIYTASGPRPFVVPRALETGEIRGVVEQFAWAAERARSAGFDGVEIHAATGYLIDQFLRDGTNRRRDKYGGSVANRARFLLEAAEAVVGVWGPGKVGVRFTPVDTHNSMHDSDPVETFGYAARALNPLNLAYLHVVEDLGEGPSVVTPFIRKVFDGPLMANGGYGGDSANDLIASGGADLVSFGTAFLANPDLPARLQAGATLNIADHRTFYGGDHRGFTDYPVLEASGIPLNQETVP